MSEQPATGILQIEDLTEKAMTFIEPFQYEKMLASFHYDSDGVLTQSQIVGTRHKRLDDGGWPALKEHMEIISRLHAEAPIFAVLGGLVNRLDLSNEEYILASYICRKGIHGDGPDFTKYNPIIDGIMA